MAGDAPDSTDPISLARQVVEDAIRLVRAELGSGRLGAEAGTHPVGRLRRR